MMLTKRQCTECGGPYESRQYNAEFCSDACRRSFNNRRAKRGAILYDLLMIEQRDAEALKKHKMEDRMKELVEQFKQEDIKANRKRTWKRPMDVMYDTMALLR